jgi:hypothetical protein
MTLTILYREAFAPGIYLDWKQVPSHKLRSP